MKLYHGSKVKFEKFNYNFIGSNSGSDEGYGFYFTDNKELAKQYAGKDGYLYTVNVPVSKSLSETKITITIERLRKMLRLLHKEIDILNDFNDVSYYGIERVLTEAVTMLRDGNNNDVDLIAEICNICGDKEAVFKMLYRLTGIGRIASKKNKFTDNGDNSKIIISLIDDVEILKVERV